MLKICLVLALVGVAGRGLAGDPAPQKNCPEGVAEWPDVTDCRSFWHCSGEVEAADKCLWLLRRFNRETLKCDWAWRVDCSIKPKVPEKPTQKPSA